MKYMTINNQKVAFDDEKNVLSVIRKAGINLPTFCYHSELSTYGACRMCVVEVEGVNELATACNTKAKEGMVVQTASERVRQSYSITGK